MKPKDMWVSNYVIPRVGYYLPVPWSGWGLNYVQKVFFGKEYITQHFNHMIGVDLLGAYFKKSELRAMIEAAVEKVFADPAFIENNHKEAYEYNKNYFNYAQELSRLDLKSQSDEELADIVSKIVDHLAYAQAHAVITTWFVDSDGQDLTNRLLGITENYVKKAASSMQVSEAFSLLTTPTQISFLIQEEIESLKVLKLILSNKESTFTIQGLSDFEKMPIEIQKDIAIAMNAHFEKWQWTPFAYLGPAYKIGDYLKFWQEQIRAKVDPDKKIKEKNEKPAFVEKKKADLKKQLHMSAEDARIFDITADIIFLKGYRKDVSFCGYYILNKVFQEIGRRRYLSINQLQVMAHFEIIDMLKSGKEPNMNVINDRLKKDTIILYENRTVKILSGDDAVDFLAKEDKNIEKDVIDENAKEFKGVCACGGQATGVIKIVNTPEEMHKMNDGDVMLAHTTFPSLVPAMKKASAIITEDGGVTCHAAIVARELGTPCVTGVKLLIKVLKDGDMVEVDADKGIIRILS